MRKQLFNPVIEKLDARGTELRDYEIDTVDGAPVQYVQVWLHKSLAGANL